MKRVSTVSLMTTSSGTTVLLISARQGVRKTSLQQRSPTVVTVTETTTPWNNTQCNSVLIKVLFRPLFNLKERIIGGREAKFGEAPYQARIRYFRQMSFGSQRSDHQCGGTLISSCWVLTGVGHTTEKTNWITYYLTSKNSCSLYTARWLVQL